ncbi:MAG TPA: proline--tRNA ligase [Methanomicrobia archaeon]|nr:proline--tRNA ligase [Methanomicrobia archaeon]
MPQKEDTQTVIPKDQHFSEWYSEILKRAEILDVRYPIKGVYVWFPYGYKLRNLVYRILRSLLDEEHEEVQFPMLIPEDELLKEKEHIKGFEEEVFWVTRGGSTELEIPFALRPTSETAMYPIFKVWIRSHADLPLRVYQIVNTFRYETKHTRPLIRLREITSFKEAHTAHASRLDAEEQVKKAVALYKCFFDQLAVPYLITRRPQWDKFPGAAYSIAFDTIMPDGRTLQIGTIHLLGESFARTFDIKFEDKDGSLQYVNQTCYGISERCVASVIGIHGDDHGLVLPPTVAPIQVVMVPIVFSRKEDWGNDGSRSVEATCAAVRAELEKAGIRVILDNSDERPGAKYYHWEMRGVPLRIELGPRDLKNESCLLVRRDTSAKRQVPLNAVVQEVQRTLEEIQTSIRESAEEQLHARMYNTNEDPAELFECAQQGVVSVFLCENEQCGEKLEEQLGVSVLGEPVSNVETAENEASTGRCVICAQPGKRVYVARAY